MNNQHKFISFRKQYPFLAFENFTIDFRPDMLHITYVFNLSDSFTFNPTLKIPWRSFYKPFDQLQHDSVFRYLIFQLGMAELISYWKASCPATIIIKPYLLSEKTKEWWKKLFYYGLGEFFYLNGIQIEKEDIFHFENTGIEPPVIPSTVFREGFLVPVGGGKDSVVSLDLLHQHFPVIPFLLNPRKAMTDTIKQSGYEEKDAVVFLRTIDPELLKMNALGYLNGHTPFSALLAFQCMIASHLTGFKHIALSNEASANEATIPGTAINHQYSKTIDFERDFRYYLTDHLHLPINYFSFLRPLLELQIACLFSKKTKYFNSFRSCNAGNKTNSWCGQCPKCLFAYIMLSPFLDSALLQTLFGADLLGMEQQWEHLKQLCGIAEEKPFDCIGTVDEVNIALHLSINQHKNQDLPLLLKRYKATSTYREYLTVDPSFLLKSWNKEHFLPAPLARLLHQEWISCNL